MSDLGSNFFTSYEREPAKRVFAAEFREATKTFKDTKDEKSPLYILLPTGERCNRIFLVGTITQKDKVGDQSIVYRARISDPTGVFFVTAGSYQPDAIHQLAKIDPENPVFVAVVGKPSVYTTSEGKVFSSVRAESVLVVDQDTRDLWVQDTALLTLDRIDTALTNDSCSDALLARETYMISPEHWRRMVYNALSRMIIL